MSLNQNNANALCAAVVDGLLAWKPLKAALQNGGLESAGAVPIGIAIENFFSIHDPNKICVREYKIPSINGRLRIDYALVDQASVGKARLKVKDVIEVKFNYASQGKVIGNRTANGLRQAAGYIRPTGVPDGVPDAYLLYLVADPFSATKHKPKPGKPVDSGWKYWRKPGQSLITSAIGTITQASRLASGTILGSHHGSVAWCDLYCILIRI